jgi:DNA-binding MarR family transcriptional regulator
VTELASLLQRELRQTKPFSSPAQEAILSILRTADVLRARAAEAIEPHGITLQQYNVLRILRGAEPVGLPTLEVAERMIEKAPGITRLLDRLERKHLVLRTRSRDDRRQVFCRITDGGLRLLNDLEQPLQALHNAIDERLAAAGQQQLIHLLDILREPAAGDTLPHQAPR